jgi:hypothetical protein
MIRGRFWGEGTDSKTDSDNEEIDQQSCSLHKMSISSPSDSSGIESRSNPHRSVSTEVKSQKAESRIVVRFVSSISGTSNGSSPSISKSMSWDGPLPQPRVSPMLSIGDAIEKAKVIRSPPLVAAASAAHRGSAARQTMPELGLKVPAQSEILGAGSAHRNSNSKLELGLSWAAPGTMVPKRVGETLGLHCNVPY